MNNDNDSYLCTTYPKMFVNRDKSMMETCMCWGFECGNGWFNILNQLCQNIQHHVDWREHQIDGANKYNQMVTQCKAGIYDLFEEENKEITDQVYKEKKLRTIIDSDCIKVPDSIPQVTLDQVKEKFGTLRFYYTGGDDYIRGLVSMAESMSGVTCEECGNLASTDYPESGGWINTTCDPCKEKRGRAYQNYKENTLNN